LSRPARIALPLQARPTEARPARICGHSHGTRWVDPKRPICSRKVPLSGNGLHYQDQTWPLVRYGFY
jgi:hypothetical protein